MHRTLAIATLAFTAAAARAQAPVVGQPLRRWASGWLDIHQISTGRGNSALIVMPDGTTLLVNAGAAGDGIPETDPHPDASRRPGQWIARYVRHHMPDSTSGLDYALITHFHPDHVAGIGDVADAIPIHTLIDRAYPMYDYPAPLTDSLTASYRRFINARRDMRVERFLPGSASQIVMRHPAQGTLFEVRNIIGNGVVWTGAGDTARALFPPIATLAKADWPNENMCSLGIRITYGRFRYFTGGDVTGTPDPGFPAWHAIESAIASVIGHVDVHVVNQHGSMGEESERFQAALGSTVLIIPSWAPSHPAPDVLKRIVNSRFAPAERAIFATDLRDATRIVIGQRASSLAGPPGHIVVRVEPGGARYWVAVLTNADESDRVLAVRGPFATEQ